MGGARAVGLSEVARLGGARAVESCEKMYKSKSRANFIVFFSPVSRDSGVWAEKVKSEVARLGGARAVGSATLAFGPKK